MKKATLGKRFLAVFLCFVMCFSMLPVSAFAEGPEGFDETPIEEEEPEELQDVQGSDLDDPELDLDVDQDPEANPDVDVNEDPDSDPDVNQNEVVEPDPDLVDEYCTVTFVYSDGNEDVQTTVKKGEAVTEPDEPTLEGYVFDGWYLGEAKYDFNQAVNGDITLTASWKESKPETVTVTVTFDADNGEEPVVETVDKGETVKQPMDPEKDGYEFDGWYLGEKLFDFEQPVDVDLVLKASWKQVQKRTIDNLAAMVGEEVYPTLEAAIEAAEEGDTVILLRDVVVNNLGTNGRLPISKSLTIDGAGYTITINGRGFGVGMNATGLVDVVFQNVTIKNTDNGARCIDTRGYIGSLTLIGVTLDTQGATGYTQPLTIGGNQSDAAVINIEKSTIQTNDDAIAYYAIITFNPVEMTITDSTIKGWACIYAKGPNSSAGSAGSVFTISNSTLVSTNVYAGNSNAFGMLTAEDDVTFDISNSSITINANSDQYQAIALNATVNLGEGNSVTLNGENAVFGLNNAEVKISGGTFNVDPSVYVAEGYEAKNNGDGTFTVGEKEYVAQIGETKYETLQAAVTAAQAGETVEVLVAGEYTLPNLPKNITIEGAVDGVVFKHTGSGNIAAVPNGATFNNVGFEFGNNNYHGFQHAGALSFINCTFSGKWFSYGDITFDSCVFNQDNADYHMWVYSGNITYERCRFTNTANGKFLNIYNESGETKYQVSVTDCTFVNEGSLNKAALNVKETCGTKALAYDVTISGCTLEGAFPENSITDGLVVGADGLYQVDDRLSNDDGSKITVTLEGEKVYPLQYAAKVGEKKYMTFAEAAEARANDDDVITLLTDIPVTEAYTLSAGILKVALSGKDLTVVAGENSVLQTKLEGDVTTYSLAPAVAKIGDTLYASLADAIAAVPADGTETTVTMIADEESDPVAIPAEKNVVLDLNGKTVSGDTGALITNNGTLTICDNSDSADGKLSNSNGLGYAIINMNAGKLSISGGTIEADTVVRSGGTGSTVISGGTINGMVRFDKNVSEIAITGGRFAGEITAAGGHKNFITGGLYADAPNNMYCAEGLFPIANLDEATKNDYPYAIGKAVAAVNGVNYATFGDAVAARTDDNDVVTLLANISDAYTLESGSLKVAHSGKNLTVNVKENCILTKETAGDVTTYSVTEAVAKIGSELYETLEAAFAEAQDGDTIELLKDIALTDRLFVNAGAEAVSGRFATTSEGKSVTLDLNGHAITSSSNIALAGGSLNITGSGEISTTTAGLAPVEVRGTGSLDAKRTLTIGAGVTLTGAEYGLNVFGSNDAQKNVIDVTVDGMVNGTLFVLGNLTNTANEINIVVNGTVTAAGTSDDSVGIAVNGYANVTVNDNAAVSGNSGIEVRAGVLTVNGGTISATAGDYSYTANGSGCTTKGAAVAVAQHNTRLPISVTISGGALNGVKTIGVTDVNNDMSQVTVLAQQSLTGNSVIPEDYQWTKSDTSDLYELTEMPDVAKIGETKYKTLEAAFAAAKSGDTVEVIVSEVVELPATSVIPEGVTLTGQGADATTLKITTANGDGVKITNPNVTISNLTIDGSNITSGGYMSLINVEADGCVIDGVIMQGGGTSTWNSSILVEKLTAPQTFTVKNSNISGSFRGVLRESCNANIVIDGCEIDAVYPFNIDGGNGGTVKVSDSKLHGWTSYSGVEKVTFTNCEFSKGNSGYDCVAAYVDTEFNGCTFDSDFKVYAQTSQFDFNFNNCKKDNQDVTREDFMEQFPNDPNVWVKCDTYVNGKLVGAVAEVGAGTDTKEYKTLQKALYAAHELTGSATVKLLADITEVAVVRQKAGLDLVLDGDGKTITGQIHVDGNGRSNGTDTLTIQNINFVYDADTYEGGFVNLPNTKNPGKVYTTGAYNYAHNITVQNCNFAGVYGTTTAFNFGSIGGGIKNIKLTNLTADAMHSLAQMTGVENATIEGCALRNSKNGISLTAATGIVSVTDSEISVNESKDGYTFRMKGASSASATLSGNTFRGFEGLVMQSTSTGKITVVDGKYAGPLPTDGAKFTVQGGVFSVEPAAAVCGKDAQGNQLCPINNPDESTKTDYPYTVGAAVARIGDNYYGTLEAAFAAAVGGNTIELLKDSSGNGIVAPQGKFTTGLTVDFGNHTYTVDGATVGSTGTETQAFQLLKDNKITFKNGTISSEKAKILVQNYSDLTLDNMKLDGSNLTDTKAYTLSTNNGTTLIKDSTIIAKDGGFAFDACSGWGGYASNTVEVVDSTITGDVEVSYYGQTGTAPAVLTLTSGSFSGAIVMAKGADKATVTKVNASVADDAIGIPADYKWVDNGNGTSKLTPKDYVAQIGETKYETLAAAIAAAQDDDVVTLLKDVAEVRNVVSKSITLDLGGKTLTGRLTAEAGTVTVKNGTIVGRVDGYDSVALTIADDATVNGQLIVWGDGENGQAECKTPVVTVNGTVTNSSGSAISTNGLDKSGAQIIVGATAKISSDDIAIYLPSGNLAVDGGEITGATAIYQKSGSLVVNGGKITGNGAKAEYSFNGNGAGPTGDAIVVESCDYPNGTPVAEIKGGTITSANALQVGYYENSDNAEFADVTATDDTLTIPTDYKWVETETAGTYKLTKKDYVAQVGETKYETLVEAVAAAKSGETVKLLKDASGAGIFVAEADSKNITIDLSGYTYTVTEKAVGSTGTATQAFHLEKNNTIAIQNGTITSTEDSGVLMLVQNYSNLTLTDVTLDGTKLPGSGRYVLSNNNGEVVVKNTTINAKDGDVAFDVCRYASYPSVKVTVEDSTINGAIEISASSNDPKDGSGLTLKGQTTVNGVLKIDGDLSAPIEEQKILVVKDDSIALEAPADYKWIDNGNNTKRLTPKDYVAQIGEAKYETLEEAFAAAKDGETVELLKNCAGNGIKAPQGKFSTGVTVDFKGFTYTVDGATVGSTGTETNGFQLLKDNKITFKNGTISSEKAKILVQNYSDLTLDGMTLTLNNTGYTSAYTLSNNNGNIVIKDSTINANPAGGFAFDVCRYASYPSVKVTVEDSTINGDVEVYASDKDAKDGLSLTLEGGTFSGKIVLDDSVKPIVDETPDKARIIKANSITLDAPDDYKWTKYDDDHVTLGSVYVAKNVNTDTKYTTLNGALAAAKSGETVVPLTNITDEAYILVMAGVTLDLDGYNVTGATLFYVSGTLVDHGETRGQFSADAYYLGKSVNSEFPIYNSETDTYSLYDVTIQQFSDNGYTYRFYKNGDERQAAANAIAKDPVALGRVKAAVDIKWSEGTVGTEGYKDCKNTVTFSDEMLRSYAANPKNEYQITFTGLDSVESSVKAIPTFFVFDPNGAVMMTLYGPGWTIKE